MAGACAFFCVLNFNVLDIFWNCVCVIQRLLQYLVQFLHVPKCVGSADVELHCSLTLCGGGSTFFFSKFTELNVFFLSPV